MSCRGWCLSFQGCWETLQEHQGVPMAEELSGLGSPGPCVLSRCSRGAGPCQRKAGRTRVSSVDGEGGSLGYIWAHRLQDPDSGALPGFPEVKNPPVSGADARDVGSVPGLRRSSGEGTGNPLQYSCLEDPMDSGGWRATVNGIAKSWTRLSD